MTIRILPYAREHEDGVRAFNARLAAARLDSNLYSTRFPECHVPAWLPKRADCDLYQECFVAVDDESVVRGAYMLKHQSFLVNGELLRLADFQLPISEGIIDGRFTTIAVRLYVDAIRRQPHIYGLGGGGYHVPVVRFLMAAGCQTVTVPFFFRVVSPKSFLMNIATLRSSRLRCAALDCLAQSGLGWLAIQAAQRLRRTYRVPASVACDLVDEFSDWADGVWRDCRSSYSLVAVRDRTILNVLYPRSDSRFMRLRVLRQGKPIGWAVLLHTQMSGHKQFGDMHVGTLVDCLAAPHDAHDVVACAKNVLESSGVDLIVSNQCSQAWQTALRDCGFLSGPSNFPFLAAPRLAARLQPFQATSAGFHLNRGDGDGPINL
jgi:hypothetical protein